MRSTARLALWGVLTVVGTATENPSAPPVDWERAHARLLAGDLAPAEESYRTAMATEPDDLRGVAGLVETLLAAKRWE